jgi:hypothetical protein
MDLEPKVMRPNMGRSVAILAALLLLSFVPTGTEADTSCTDCHNPNGIAVPHDSGCRDTSCAQTCHPKQLGRLLHPWGPGTPLSSDRTATCNSCHNLPFPDVYHPYNINVTAGSTTAPGVVDLDQACGQCHGGGNNGTSNPPQPGAPYMSKWELAGFARGIHNDTPYVSFGYQHATPDTLTVNLSAWAECAGRCSSYTWNCGSGGTLSVASPPSTALAASCTYATPGKKTITLTVSEDGVGTGSNTKTVHVYTPDYPPVVDAICTWDANTWTMSVTDASTDDDAVAFVAVNWGDGSRVSTGTDGDTFEHAYRNHGNYTIAHKAFDSIAQESVTSCVANASYFAVGGKIYEKGGATAVPAEVIASARILVKSEGIVVRRTYSAVDGSFAAGSLKPGTYTLTVTRTGYTFDDPAATVTVGPSTLNHAISATAP